MIAAGYNRLQSLWILPKKFASGNACEFFCGYIALKLTVLFYGLLPCDFYTMLSKSEALNLIEKRGPKGKRIQSHVAFITANRIAWAQKKKALAAGDTSAQKMDVGGKFIEYSKCMSSSPRGMHSAKAKHTPSPSQEGNSTPLNKSRQPNHWVNRTVNIEMAPGQIRKVHKSLIMEVNHIKVQY